MESKDKKHASNWSQPNRNRIIGTTRATFYAEGNGKTGNKGFNTTHDKATTISQGGEENMGEVRKEPRNNTAKEQSSHQELKVPPSTPRNNSKYQETKTLTSRDIMTMVGKGEMTDRQAEIKFKELGKMFSQKMTMEIIVDMVNKVELTMEEGEIELKNLESKED